MASDGDRFRLAIALSALKFKPPTQSFPAYVLELQSKFPPSSPDLASDNSWRNLALSLEHDFAVLKGKYEAEQIRSLALEHAVSASSVMPNSSLEQPTPAKKKSKKKPMQSSTTQKRPDMPPPPLELKSILEGLSARLKIDVPRISPSYSLISSFDDFIRLTSLPEVEPDLLLSVTLRTIEAVARNINSIVMSQTPNVPSDPNTLEHLGLVLNHVLAVVLPSLAPLSPPTQESTEPIISLLDRTTTLVLNPLIHAFSLRSETYLNSLFLPSSGGISAATSFTMAESSKPSDAPQEHLPVDVRTDMLCLFKKIFSFLDGQLHSLSTLARPSLVLHTLRASLILKTVWEIDRLLSAAPTIGSLLDPNGDIGVSTKQYHQTRPDRVKKLATKDSLWSLCTILHILFGEPAPLASQPVTVSIIAGTSDGNDVEEAGDAVERNEDAQGREERLLCEGMSDALFKLIIRCKRPESSPLPSQIHTQKISASGLGTVGQRASHSADGASDARWEKQRLVGLEGNDEEPENLEVAGSRDKTEDMGRDERRGHDDERIDVGVDTGADVNINAAEQFRKDSSRDHSALSVPQGTSKSCDKFGHIRPFELNEVEYGMLLGVIERYWVWSKS